MEKFGHTFSIPENIKINVDDQITSITHKAVFEFTKEFDRKAIESIIEGAKRYGLTEVVVWDGIKIIEALKKQISSYVILTEDECLCPSCGFDMMGVLDYDPKHCPECGQKLIWGTNNG